MQRNEQRLHVVAIVLALVGLLMIVGAIANLTDRTAQDAAAVYVAELLLLGILPLVLSAWLVLHSRRAAAQRAFEAREQVVLHLARRHRGTLTVPQVVEETDMTLEQAKAVLEHLYHQSFTEPSLTDSGELVYRFPL